MPYNTGSDNNYHWKFILLHTANYIWNFQAIHPCYMYAHAFLSMCITITMVKIWALSANWLGLQSNALWICFVQVHCNMHAFCNHVSLHNIFLFPKIEYEKKNILILYKVLMEKKYMPEGYRNFQSMYIKKYIYAMTKLFFIIACK